METVVLDARRDPAASISAVVEQLRSGNVVALPTETVYGLAGDVFNPSAVARIFAAKDRPLFDPLIVHVLDLAMLRRVAKIESSIVSRLIERFWPGPLTLILPKRPEISELVTAGSPLVAVRMPSHPVFQAVLAELDRPLAAPSANPFGAISPTAAAHVLSGLGRRIPLILDAGECQHGLESTIVYVENDELHVLRAGPISAEELAEFGRVRFAANPGQGAAPGQLASHYAPRKPLQLVQSSAGLHDPSTSAFLAFSKAPVGFCATETLSESGDLIEAAARLFAALHRLDAGPATRIYAERIPETGLGRAIMDRLQRAAAK